MIKNRACVTLVSLAFCAACGGAGPTVQPESRAPNNAIEPAEPWATRGLKYTTEGAAIPPPDWRRTLISLVVTLETTTGVTALVGDGARVRSGEHLVFRLRVARPVSAYVVQVSPQGNVALLYPPEGNAELLSPDIEQRIPKDPRASFVLDDEVGREEVWLIACDGGRCASEPAIANFIEHAKGEGRARPPVPSGPSPSTSASARSSAAQPKRILAPEHLSMATRGMLRDPRDSGRTLDVQADASGMVVAKLHFEHVP